MRVLWLAFLATSIVTPIAAAQQRQVRGIVTDEDTKQPVIGAVITVRGERGLAQTSADGRFALLVTAGPAHLLVRALGYAPKDVPVAAADTAVAITLHSDPLELESVVVTGQATSIERRLAATSTAVVDNQQLNQVAAASVDKALQGKVAGANIQTNSGEPGGGAQIQIRGINTVIGASDPVFVVDGVIYSNATVPSGLGTVTNNTTPAEDDADNRLADLNPDDIASIEILKSAAASSIYGSKAANGVVIITTKRGIGGKPRATISQSFGFSELLRGPGERVFDTTTAFSVYSSTEDSAIIRNIARANNGRLPVYDHLREIAGQKPFNYQTLLSVSGGNDNTKYYVSGEWTYNGGIVANTDAGRRGIRVNLDQHLSDRLQLSLDNNFVHSTTDRGMTNNDNAGASLTYALAYIPSFIDLRPNKDGIYPQPAFTYLGSNPLQTIALAQNSEAVDRYTGGGTLTLQAITSDRNNLKLVAAGGIDFFNQQNSVYAPPTLYFEANQANPGVSTLGDAHSRYINWNLNAIHAFTPQSMSLKFTTSAGLQYEDRQLNEARVTAQGLLPGQSNIDQGSVFGQPFEQLTHERTVALYGDEQVVAFAERLMVEAGIRAERSSVFGNTNKYFTYPKISAAYRFPGLLGEGSDFKLRGAYGETGNQPLFGQKFTTLIGGNVIGGNVGTVVGGVAGAPNIEPERVKEFEGGFDVSPFNGRATLEFTAYKRRTTNLLLDRTPAASTGYGEVIINGGQISNKGIELALGMTAIEQRDFNWLIRSTFNRTRSNVDYLPVPGFRPPTAGFGLAFGEFFVQQGRPVGQIIGQTGVNPDGTFKIGYLGDVEPDFTWTLSNDFTYKIVTLSALWDWQHGGVAQNQTLSLYDCNLLAPDQATPAGQERANDCLNTGIATPFVQSTSYLKLREVSIGVTLPNRLSEAWFHGAQNVSIRLTGRNLLIFTKYFGYDPEVSDFGQQAITRNVDLGPYPPSRTFSLTVSAGF